MDIKKGQLCGVWFIFNLLAVVPAYAQISKGPEFSEKPQISGSVSFENFGQKVTLLKQGEQYRVSGTHHLVKISNRLVIKTLPNISIQMVAKMHDGIEKVQTLFKGTKNTFFVLRIKQMERLADIMQELTKNKNIVLVQPDILQLKTKTQKSYNRGFLNRKFYDYLTSVINIQALWEKTKGDGIKIAVIDDGFDLNHKEFSALRKVLTYDMQSHTFSAQPRLSDDNHGTQVAGIIFSGHEQSSVDGIAPNAELIAIRHVDTWTSMTLLSFHIAMLAQADIINCSWNSHWLMEPVADVINELAIYAREGKGIAVVFSAGNKGEKILPYSSEAAVKNAIVVAAHDAALKPFEQNNFGDAVDLFAYGGKARTTRVGGKYSYFSGTSLSTAVVSGLSALLLSMQPSMTLNELLYQLRLITRFKSINET